MILPVLIPSWRFFKSIEPSPRVQWAALSMAGDADPVWRAYRPRPADVAPLEMLWRLFWNPAWNEDLFVVSCAERIRNDPTPHSINEIQRRVIREIDQTQTGVSDRWFQFRVVFVHRDARGLIQEVLFVSEAFETTDGEAA